MDFDNKIKGKTAEHLFRQIMEEAGYKVAPLGIEEIIPGLADLSQDKYLALNLPHALRKTPDFFVIDPNKNQCWLVEVKYRKSWTIEVQQKLGEILKEQLRAWSPLMLVVLLGEPVHAPHGSRNGMHVHARTAKLTLNPEGEVHFERNWTWATDDTKTIAWEDAQWSNFNHIDGYFDALSEANVGKVIAILQGIAKIDHIKNSR